MADHTPGARQVETWMYQETEAGEVVHAAQLAMSQTDLPKPMWFYLLPLNQSRLD